MRRSNISILTVLLLAVTACSLSPCSRRYVIQVTTDPGSKKAEAAWASAEVFGKVLDVELDDRHIYAANFTRPLDATAKEMEDSLGPDTGDKVELCALTAADGSRHSNLHVKGTHYAATLIR